VIEILASHAANTIQDRGRFGARRLGVSTSGVMDPLALAAGNLMLGNDAGAASIEVQTFPFRLRFTAATRFAVTGADCDTWLAGRTLPPWWCGRAGAGDVLELGLPKRGARAYLSVPGGIAVPAVLGSRSTHLRAGFGGHEGRAIAAGDRLAIGPDEADATQRADFGVTPAAIALPGHAGEAAVPGQIVVRVLRAGEYDFFPAEMQRLFWETAWKISLQSDRTGYRLAGAKLLLPEPVEMRSHGVVPGVVQVPPAGEPIIQMSDANTAGGYPKMATVIEADLWRLGQAGPGARIRFAEVSYREAVAAMAPVEAYVADIARTAALYRTT
jgi:biotin-dependent carboxylase-like uncharacterized protein